MPRGRPPACWFRSGVRPSSRCHASSFGVSCSLWPEWYIGWIVVWAAPPILDAASTDSADKPQGGKGEHHGTDREERGWREGRHPRRDARRTMLRDHRSGETVFSEVRKMGE